jgi:prepilin signal peptidase PulO-like enzyme (type II secretory pathway)
MGLVLGWRAELGVIFYVAIFGGFGAAIARWRKRDEFAYGPAIALGLLAYMVHEYLRMFW